MRSWLWMIAAVVTANLIAAGCNRREQDPPTGNPERENELRLFREGIQTVQDRYVDPERVHMDSIISNSIKGMVAEIDPYASIYFSGDPAEDKVIPADVSLVELLDGEDRHLVILKVYGFQPQTRKQLRSLESAARSRSPAGVLIDARGATGNDYHAALDIAAWLLPRNTVVGSIVEKQGAESRPLTTRRPPLWTTNVVMMLIDHDTSGPAEWLAAALQFHHRVDLVGEASRGVTVIQTPVPITDQWTAMLTTGRVLNPDGRDITGNPLKPDIAVTPEADDKENVDWIYLRGMATLKAQLEGADGRDKSGPTSPSR